MSEVLLYTKDNSDIFFKTLYFADNKTDTNNGSIAGSYG